MYFYFKYNGEGNLTTFFVIDVITGRRPVPHFGDFILPYCEYIARLLEEVEDFNRNITAQLHTKSKKEF